MEKDILKQVIDAEKEIQKRLDIEKTKIREWLENEKRACDEEFVREEKAVKSDLEQTASRAVEEAQARTAGIVSRASDLSDRVRRVKAEVLATLVKKRIDRILPG